MTIPFLNGPSGTAVGLAKKSQTTRVLLIEDNTSDALLVRSALSDREFYGSLFAIDAAPQLSAAIARLASERFDVILLDLSLPDSQSLEHSFFSILQHAGNTPIIVLTGVDDEALGLKMVRDGAQDYLIKSKVERYLLIKAIRYAIERQRSEQALRKSRAELQLKLIAAQEQERQRIARELHDQMGQSIAALMLGLKSLAHSYQSTDQARSQFQQLQNLAGELARDVHSLALDLRPTALDDLGLEVALSNHLDAWSNRWQIGADFHSHGFMGQRVASHLETTIYRIASEALTNIGRHANARAVSLILERAEDRVVLIIEDNGCGFDVEAVMKNSAKEQRLGLLGMEERVALVGGSLTIESTPALGTTVYVRIPISFQPNGEVPQWKN